MTVSVGLRFDVLQRDNFTCRYCGKQAHEIELEVDHIHPRSRGGDDRLANLVTACWPCNRGKGSRPIPPPLMSEWKSLVGKAFVRWDAQGYPDDCGVVLGDLGDGYFMVRLHDPESGVRYSNGTRVFHIRQMRDRSAARAGGCWHFADSLVDARRDWDGAKKREWGPEPRPLSTDPEVDEDAETSLADVDDAPLDVSEDAPDLDEDGTPLVEAPPEFTETDIEPEDQS